MAVGPTQVALARAVERIPEVSALPGGCRYEPKWDGFRAVVTREDAGATLRSRRGTDLSATFPEITAAAVAQLAPGAALDGELVVWTAGRLDFEALQERMGRGPRTAAAASRSRPASLAVFDLLAVDGRDLRPLPFDERRALLEQLAASWSPPLNLSPVTASRDVAVTWFETYAAAGIEGLVVKGGAQRYTAGERAWLKVKRRTTLDVIAGAVIGSREAPQQVVAGLPVDGRLRIVGRTGPLSPGARVGLARWLTAPIGEHPWPAVVPPGAFGRFNAQNGPVVLTLVEPIVVEVSADAAWNGRGFRHLLRFVRVQPEAEVASVQPPP
ncbi:ATP-dependent DNA ligase [Antribacter gilvus]|uniref:ATP-dependent DNA ligase n=1 Tax=Antribacter gilvus TaxID=2304675 RepID=UPI000F7B9EAE|nr:ATP-dependent DNA ligase [Antribacter gilvus]